MSNRVLIVDDEPANVELLKAYLVDVGDDLRGLTDSRQVEYAFREFEPDIMLLDLHMPNLDGLEVLRRLRSARESLGYFPVVVLTGDTTNVARNAALITTTPVLGVSVPAMTPDSSPDRKAGRGLEDAIELLDLSHD